MERLNEIMARTMQQEQRRRRTTESQSPQAAIPQQQGLNNPQPGTPQRRLHRPMQEQMARLGRQPVPAPQPYNAQGQYSPLSRTRPVQGNPPQPSRPQTPLQRSDVQGEADARPAYVQRPHSPREPHQYPEYYQADSETSIEQADVADGWEDDAAGMRYGDWESDEHEEQSYVRQRSGSASRINRSFVAQDIAPAASLEARPYLAHAPREVQVSSPVPPLPAAHAETREMGHFQRTTQPLSPHTSLRMSQSSDASQGISRTARPTRQLVVHEQAPFHVPPSPATLSSICPLCKGAGYLRADVPYGHPNFGKPIACECKEAERREKRRLQLEEISNLGDLKDKSFENFRPNASRTAYQAYQVALDYARDPRGWLVLIGRNGCGKTHLAGAIANKCLARGSLVLFSTVIDLLDHLRATYMPTSTEVYDQLFAKMREAELLVLDDLGAQQSSPWANEKLFQLLNYRYNAHFPTIITTNNLGLQGIEERIRSRMTDASLVTIVTFDGAQDFRPRNPRRE